MRSKLAGMAVFLMAAGGLGAGATSSPSSAAVAYYPPTVTVSDVAGANTTFAFSGSEIGSTNLVSVSVSNGASCTYLWATFGYWWNCPGTMQWELNLRDGADTVTGTADQHVHIFANSSDADNGSRQSGVKTITIGSRYGALKVEGGTSNDHITLTEEMVYPGIVDGGPGDDWITGVKTTYAPLESAVDNLNGGNGADTIDDYDGVKDTINCGGSDNNNGDNVYFDSNNHGVTDALSNCGNDHKHPNTPAPSVSP